jgi:hypothetical protein
MSVLSISPCHTEVLQECLALVQAFDERVLHKGEGQSSGTTESKDCFSAGPFPGEKKKTNETAQLPYHKFKNVLFELETDTHLIRHI